MQTLDEAKEAPIRKRLSFLKEVWQLEQPVVFGQLRHWKDDLWHVTDVRNQDWEKLEYPFSHDLRRTSLLSDRGIFVGSCPEELKDRYVQVRFEICGDDERANWRNPFLLQAARGGITPLALVPPAAVVATPDGGFLVADSIARSVIDVLTEKIDLELVAMRNHHDEEIARYNSQLDYAKLTIEAAERSIATLAEREEVLSTRVSELTTERDQIVTRIEDLREFVQKRADWLRHFALISEAQYSQFMGDGQVSERPAPLLRFDTDLNSSLAALVSCVQLYLASKKQKLLYPRYLIEDFLTLLRCNDLVILAGTPGSGKTQLVRSLAQALGGEARIVPVKPNWTSADDLLGYYNPIQRGYVETEFLRALRDAAADPSRLYLICLDEMNLARIEHYFADFLSKLEDRDSSPCINLYAADIWEAASEEFQHFCEVVERITDGETQAKSLLEVLSESDKASRLRNLLGSNSNEEVLALHTRMRRLVTSALAIQPDLPLPSNVRFIGTVNIDSTTHYLSPKLLDRAHVLRFPGATEYSWDHILGQVQQLDLPEGTRTAIEDGARGQSPLVQADLGRIFAPRAPYPDYDPADPLALTLTTWLKEYLAPLGVDVSLRAIRQAIHYRNLMRDLNTSETRPQGDSVALNNIVLHKVLPRLAFRGEDCLDCAPASRPRDGELEKGEWLGAFQQDLQKVLGASLRAVPMPKAHEVLERLMARAVARDAVYNYWL